MTIQEMHIGIDAGLKRLNSNVLNALLPEEKDFYINKVTSEFIRAVLLDEKNTIKDIVSYIDIRKYYEVLQVYISNVAPGIQENLDEGYFYIPLPPSAPMIVTNSGQLYNGVRYKVVNKGNTYLADWGYQNPVTQNAGDEFVCKIKEHLGSTSETFNKGDRIKILNAAHFNYTLVGAPNNDPNTYFQCTVGYSSNALNIETHHQYTSKQPAWSGAETDTKLYPLSNCGFYLYISSKSNINKGVVFASGALERGTKYKVLTSGTTNLAKYGGYSVANDVNATFMCIEAGTPLWDGVTELVKTKEFPNRLVKAQDIDNMMFHSFGSTPSSPIALLTDNELRVYTGNKFTINDISLRYIKAPVQVSYINEINSDLPTSLHDVIVDLVVELLAAHTGSEDYQAIAQQNAKNIK